MGHITERKLGFGDVPRLDLIDVVCRKNYVVLLTRNMGIWVVSIALSVVYVGSGEWSAFVYTAKHNVSVTFGRSFLILPFAVFQNGKWVRNTSWPVQSWFEF